MVAIEKIEKDFLGLYGCKNNFYNPNSYLEKSIPFSFGIDNKISFSYFEHTNIIFINNIYVKDRGKGIAKKSIELIIKNFPTAEIYVSSFNDSFWNHMIKSFPNTKFFLN